MNPTVFISYNWSPESKEVADAIDKDWQGAGITIKRDVRDVGYKGSLRAFMTSMSSGDYVLLIINEGYFKSKNCMFEALELFKSPEFHDKILPIVLDSAKIYDPLKIIDYVHFWDEKIEELNERLKALKSSANLSATQAELSHYTRIRDSIDAFIGILRDMLTVGWPKVREEKYKPIFDYINYTPPAKPEPESPQLPSAGVTTQSGNKFIDDFRERLHNEDFKRLTRSEQDEEFSGASSLQTVLGAILQKLKYVRNLDNQEIEKLNAQIKDIIPQVQKQRFMPPTPLYTTLELARTMANYGLDADLGKQIEEACKGIDRIF